MKRPAVVWALALLAVLALLPGTSQGESYVEGYLGFVQGANTSFSSRDFSGFMENPGHIDPAFMGGLRLGLWFERSGVLAGVNFPEWMKYFGFYVDFKMHRLDFPRRSGTIEGTNFTATFSSEGIAPTLAFMFAARYGFLPDKDVPFGRLQPYVAVGPGIIFTSQQPTVTVPGVVPPAFSTFDFESRSNAPMCLAVDAGVRWMALKNVSLDVFFNYRYARTSFTYSYLVPTVGNRKFTWEPNYSLFGVGAGAAYHF